MFAHGPEASGSGTPDLASTVTEVPQAAETRGRRNGRASAARWGLGEGGRRHGQSPVAADAATGGTGHSRKCPHAPFHTGIGGIQMVFAHVGSTFSRRHGWRCKDNRWSDASNNPTLELERVELSSCTRPDLLRHNRAPFGGTSGNHRRSLPGPSVSRRATGSRPSAGGRRRSRAEPI